MSVVNPEFAEEHFGLGRNFIDSLTGHFIAVPSQAIILDEFAAFRYAIYSITGTTSAGSVSVVLAINGTPITGLNGVVMDTSQDQHEATLAAEDNILEPGDLLTMTVTPTGATDFSWTVRYRRRTS